MTTRAGKLAHRERVEWAHRNKGLRLRFLTPLDAQALVPLPEPSPRQLRLAERVVEAEAEKKALCAQPQSRPRDHAIRKVNKTIAAAMRDLMTTNDPQAGAHEALRYMRLKRATP